MFWGLIMEPQRRYTQKVKKAFHISMASLDVSTSSEEPAQVMVGFEGRNYLLCTLRKPDLLQCALDLNFEVGDELSLAANGKCHVHLTGYLIEDPEEFAEEEEDDEDEEETVEKDVQKKSKKRNKEEVTNGPPVKKIKSNNKDAQAEESEEEDSDDSDVDVQTLLQKTLEESDEDDDTFVSDAEDNAEEEEEDDGQEDDSELEEEEEEEDDDESSLSEADSDDLFASGKLNGTAKKQEVLTPNKQKEKKDKKNEQKKQNTKEVKTQVQTPNKENKSPKSKEAKKVVLQNGLIIEDVKEGQGPPAKPGKFISVYYEGRLKSNNKVFDATNKGAGFSFRLGGGEVIKGWDAGLVGMKLGGKRRLTCPPNMAYGPKGSPPAIPANSTLVFEVELKKIR